MEDFLNEIREYAAAVGKKPSTVIQQATRDADGRNGLGGMAWTRWEDGGGCTVETMARIRRFMADNPPAENAA